MSAPVADGLLMAWVLGVLGYALGLGVHCDQILRYRRYLPHARDRSTVQGWIFDEKNRAVVKVILIIWGIARLGLLFQRPDIETVSPTVLHLDLLTLSLYWGLLLLFTHWTWRVRRQRAHDPELRRSDRDRAV